MLSRITDVILSKFPLFIGFYFLLQLCVRLITTHGVVLDESEQVMLTQYFALGYNAQPPLYTWLQSAFFYIFGKNVFAISLLKNIILFSIYIFTYQTALLLSHDTKKAALSALGLVFLPQIIWEAQIDQIHTVLLTASTSALLFFYFRTIKNNDLLGFIFIGVSSACGLLAKYNFAIVIVALFFATLFIKEYRKVLFNRRLFLSITVAVCLILPHLMWFLGNMDLATSETLSRMSMEQQGSYLSDVLHGSLDLIASYILFTVVFIAFFIPLFARHFTYRKTAPSNALLLYIGTTFVSILIIVFLTQTTNIKERWLQPYLYLLPLLLFLFVDIHKVSKRKINIFVSSGVGFCLIVLVVIPLRVVLVDLDSKPHRENYPFEKLAHEISSYGFSRGLILTEDKFIGGNLSLLFKDSEVITPSIPLQKYTAADVVLVVWQRKNPIEYLQAMKFKESADINKVTIPYTFSEKHYGTFFFQQLHPANAD